jgi:hypothetical protein
MRSALFMSPNCARMLLMSPSSCSAAVLQSGTRCVGVGLGAGVGGEAGADGSRLCGMVEFRGLVGVIMGRGTPDRDSLDCFRPWTFGEAYMAEREEEAVAEAAMSVSESSIRLWSARSAKYSSCSMTGGGDRMLVQAASEPISYSLSLLCVAGSDRVSEPVSV